MVEPRDRVFEAETKHDIDPLEPAPPRDDAAGAVVTPTGEPSSSTTIEEAVRDAPVEMVDNEAVGTALLATWTWEEDLLLVDLLNELECDKSAFPLSRSRYIDVQIPPRENAGADETEKERWRLLRAKSLHALQSRAAMLIHLNEYLPVQLRLASDTSSSRKLTTNRSVPACVCISLGVRGSYWLFLCKTSAHLLN